MKHLFFLLVLTFCTFSCTPKNFDKPKNLINKSEMIDIMTDLYISQQGLSMYPSPNGEITTDLAKDASNIMKNHNITFHDFQESYKYYSMKPEVLNGMLDDIKNNIQSNLSEKEKERIKNQSNTLSEDNSPK